MAEVYEYDLSAVRGGTYTKEIEFPSDVSLAGKTAYAQIRRYFDAEDLIVSFTCAIDTTDNIITISLTADQTAALTAGKYVYDMVVVSGGEVKYYLRGNFVVLGRSTVVAS